MIPKQTKPQNDGNGKGNPEFEMQFNKEIKILKMTEAKVKREFKTQQPN